MPIEFWIFLALTVVFIIGFIVSLICMIRYFKTHHGAEKTKGRIVFHIVSVVVFSVLAEVMAFLTFLTYVGGSIMMSM